MEPRGPGVAPGDAFCAANYPDGALVITNPPWARAWLHPYLRFLIEELRRPAWLLWDADWMHTKQAAPYQGHVGAVVSVGRVRWIEGSRHTGKDNCAWYHVVPTRVNITEFIFREAA